MIEKKNVIKYFDEWAGEWDENQIIYPEVIETILNNANMSAGQKVLDVACGTGVMIPYYLSRKAASVTGIDISPEMLKIAKDKYLDDTVRFFCMDAELDVPQGMYDIIVIYNAFPHFPNPEQLIKNLTTVLAPGGTITVAHGMSQAKINEHHSGSARFVSEGLMDAEALAALFSKYLNVTKIVSDEKMYQVLGVK